MQPSVILLLFIVATYSQLEYGLHILIFGREHLFDKSNYFVIINTAIKKTHCNKSLTFALTKKYEMSSFVCVLFSIPVYLFSQQLIDSAQTVLTFKGKSI